MFYSTAAHLIPDARDAIGELTSPAIMTVLPLVTASKVTISVLGGWISSQTTLQEQQNYLDDLQVMLDALPAA